MTCWHRIQPHHHAANTGQIFLIGWWAGAVENVPQWLLLLLLLLLALSLCRVTWTGRAAARK
jgi:hypothetical protein